MSSSRFLSEPLRNKANCFPETHMGVQTVTVTLRDGTTFSGVDLAWGSEVVRVHGHSSVPFDAKDVVDVMDDSARGTAASQERT